MSTACHAECLLNVVVSCNFILIIIIIIIRQKYISHVYYIYQASLPQRCIINTELPRWKPGDAKIISMIRSTWPAHSCSSYCWLTYLDRITAVYYDYSISFSLRFSGHFPAESGLASFTGAKDDGSGEWWQLELDVQSSSKVVTINKPTPNFVQAGVDTLPVAQPTVSKHWREGTTTTTTTDNNNNNDKL